MIRILDNVNILLSRLGSLRGHSQELHHARFALPHELHGLTSHLLDEEALLLGRTHLGGIYRLKPTKERRELGNMLICAPPRSGKSILAISQLLTWPHSVVVVDIKGELYQNTAGYRSALGPVYVIDPRGVGHQYDPLRACANEDALYEAAKNLLFDPKEAEGRSFTEWGILLEVLKWQACLELNRRTGSNHRLLPFSRAIGKLGIKVTPSVGNFILLHFPETPGKTATEADKALTSRGLIMRAVRAYKLPNALRMTVGPEEANRLVVKTLAEFMGR